MAPLLPPLFLPLWALWTCGGWGGQGLSSPVTLRGDYTLAGLFPVHRGNIVRSQPFKPEVDVCQSLHGGRSFHGFHLIQAMRFAVEEINNSSSLLPNIMLGYTIYDSCTSSANMYATLSLMSKDGGGECPGHQQVEVASSYANYLPKAVAAIGPDSSDNALLTASLLGLLNIPMVSYEASSPTLSLKKRYPSFLRTIPPDDLQVRALLCLLEDFNWTWVAVVASNNNYGIKGLQKLQEGSSQVGICFAYQGVLPSENEASGSELRTIVSNLVNSRASVSIVFANRARAQVFFLEVIRLNVSGMVWLGTEDWSLASNTWMIPGIHTIGTVIGISLKEGHLEGMKAFEATLVGCEEEKGGLDHASSIHGSCGRCKETCSQPCSRFCKPSGIGLEILPRDSRAIFNVYSAVYTVAHGLHRLLNCQATGCHKDAVYPWQLLKEMRQVNFSLFQRQVSFDADGDILDGYELVLWNWTGQTWNYSIIGSFDNPDRLTIDKEKLLWHTEDNQVPVSVCSPDCGRGEQKIQQGTQRCCFQCMPCLPGTFLNKSGFPTCQKCQEGQWSTARSEACFERSIEFLAWDDRVSLVLLTFVSLLLVVMVGTGTLFIRHLQTPVVKSAGGWLSVAMLCALACAGLSLYLSFGEPSMFSCLLSVPLYNISFTVVLSCMVAHSFQIVIIFKMATKAPGILEAWRRQHNGAVLLIGCLTAVQGTIALLHLSISPSIPHKNYGAYTNATLLECSKGDTGFQLSGLIYNTLLGTACFAVSYLGKDLPSSYNEAKCITFSLLIYFACQMSETVMRSVYTGHYISAVTVTSQLSTLIGIFVNYFAPKVYVILFCSERNTSQHFQMSIQSYTKRINAVG